MAKARRIEAKAAFRRRHAAVVLGTAIFVVLKAARHGPGNGAVHQDSRSKAPVGINVFLACPQ
jgi:hypothetical protein